MKYFWSDFAIFITIVFILIGTLGTTLYLHQRKVDVKCEDKGGTVIRTPYGTECAKLEIIK